MKTLRSVPPRVYLFGIGTLALLIVAFAIGKNTDVKAGFKMLGIELSIETTDRPSNTIDAQKSETAIPQQGGLRQATTQ